MNADLHTERRRHCLRRRSWGGWEGGEEEKGEGEEGILHGCAFFRVALEYLQKILENTSSRFRQ